MSMGKFHSIETLFTKKLGLEIIWIKLFLISSSISFFININAFVFEWLQQKFSSFKSTISIFEFFTRKAGAGSTISSSSAFFPLRGLLLFGSTFMLTFGSFGCSGFNGGFGFGIVFKQGCGWRPIDFNENCLSLLDSNTKNTI